MDDLGPDANQQMQDAQQPPVFADYTRSQPARDLIPGELQELLEGVSAAELGRLTAEQAFEEADQYRNGKLTLTEF